MSTAKGGLRALAQRHGFHSAFELEVAARLEHLGVDVEREGLVILYRDDVQDSMRKWTPDFRAASGAAIEVKGRLMTRDMTLIASVLAQNPDLDLRMVFQQPHRPISRGRPTPAEWADSLDLRWSTLAGLELVTMDLPRVALTHEGDRVFPDARDEALAASATSPVPDAATAP